MSTVAGTDVPVDVLHRLAFGVEPFDAVTGRRVELGLTVAEERPAPARPRRPQGLHDPLAGAGHLRPLECNGTARFKLRHGGGVRQQLTIRLIDGRRTFVPRRFQVNLWSADEVAAIDDEPPTGPFVPVLSRVLRPWLLPGTAYPLPRGATAIRARVLHDGVAVRWARVEALRQGTTRVLGHAHADDRGEFVLLVPESGGVWPPSTGQITVRLVISAPPGSLDDPADEEQEARRRDPLADLPVEAIPRPGNPPLPTDLDSPVLRGRAVPADFVTSSTTPTETLFVGQLLAKPSPYVFTP